MATIFILEDNQQLQDSYKDVFTEAGYQVIQTTDVKQSIEYMNANPPPGLIIVDLMLPGGQNGFDFIEQVQVHDTWKNTPVFLMTNLAGMDTLAHSLNINEYFEKVNVSLDTVLEKAKQYLQP